MKALDAHTMPLRGTQLVEASAGTGKTYTIANLFLRLVLEQGHAVSQILVVTYTRAATAELRHRVRERIRDALFVCQQEVCQPSVPGTCGDPWLTTYFEARSESRREDVRALKLALAGFDEAAISTIHGFCQRALTDAAFESGASFEVEFIENEQALVRELVQDYWAVHTYQASMHRIEALSALGIDSLVKLAQDVSGDDARVLPETVLEPKEPDLLEFRRARSRLAELWRESRAELMPKFLAREFDLNFRGYQEKFLTEQVFPKLDGMLEMPVTGSFDGLQRFTPSEMLSRVIKGKSPPSHPVFDACAELLAAVQVYEDYGRAVRLWFRRGLVDYVRRERSKRKRERGVQGFDDLLVELASGLSGANRLALLSRLRATYRVALIDEFQDTDPLQYRVFTQVFADGGYPLLLIGDPKQAIYGFRGADIFAYLRAAYVARASGDNTHTLGVNYRSAPGLVAGVNHLFNSAVDPFLFPEIGFEPVHARPGATDEVGGRLAAMAPLQFLEMCGPEGGRVTAQQVVAGEITALLSSASTVEGQPLEPRHLAVLCQTNRQLREVQGALSEAGIASAIEGDGNVFESSSAEELERVLVAMANPGEPRATVAALSTRLCGVTAHELLAMEVQEDGWDYWVQGYSRWHRTWFERGFIKAFHQFIGEAQVAERLLATIDGERRLTDLLHLGELLHDVAVRERKGPWATLGFIQDARRNEAVRAGVQDGAQLRLESDELAVRLTTIHKSKGLEYPVVVCPTLWTQDAARKPDDVVRFHDAPAGAELRVDIGSPEFSSHCDVRAQEERAEGLRLLYVALTRAKHRCLVLFGPSRINKKTTTVARSPLAYVVSGGGAKFFQDAKNGKVSSLDYAELRQGIRTLCEASDGCVGVRAGLVDITRLDGPEAAAAVPVCKHLTAALTPGYSVQSFSAMTASAIGHGATLVDDAADRDGEVSTVDGGEGGEGEVALADFPAGAHVGTVIHRILETVEFATDSAGLLDACSKGVAELGRSAGHSGWHRTGLPGSSRRESGTRESGGVADELASSLAGCFESILNTDGLRLAAVSRADRVDEMEFTLRAGTGDAAVSPKALGAILDGLGTQRATELGIADYGKAVAGLPVGAFFGYLRGFIDLVFRHDGRYYLVDYKSNMLGRKVADYSPEKLGPEMARKHYVLQYHLYTVALHCHLARRVPDYEYSRDFGGVFYLFLRGMNPDYPPGNGVYFDKPAENIVHDLAELFGRVE